MMTIPINRGLLGMGGNAQQDGILSPMALAGLGLMQMGQARPVGTPAPTGLLEAAVALSAQDSRSRRKSQAAQAKQMAEAEKARREAERRAQFVEAQQAFLQTGDRKAFLADTPPEYLAQALQLSPAPAAPTSTQRDYQAALEGGFKGSFLDYQTALRQAGRSVNQVSVHTGDKMLTESGKLIQDRRTIERVFGPDSREAREFDAIYQRKTAPTEGQANIAQFANQMENANAAMGEVLDKNAEFQPGNWRDYLSGGVPLVGNALMSDAGRQYRQAQEEWVRAKLREESGAVIGEEEMAREITTFFPQPGDDAKTIENKRIARERALAGLKAGQGAAGLRVEPAGPRTGTPPGLLTAPQSIRVPPGTKRPTQR